MYIYLLMKGCRLIYLIVLFSVTFNFLSAQSLKQASKFYNKGNYDKALELYMSQDSISFENNDNFKVGVCYFLANHDQIKGIPFFEKYISQSDSIISVAHFYLGSLYHKNYEFDKAIFELETFNSKIEYEYSNKTLDEELYNSFKKESENLISNCNYGKVMLKSPREVLVENLGDSINTKYEEYAPTISIDEKKLAFTSRRPWNEKSIVSDDGDFFEDIFISTLKYGSLFEAKKSMKEVNGFFNLVTPFEYTEAIMLGKTINSETHDASIQLSNDGKKLYFYRNSDVWITENEGDTMWSDPIKLSTFNSEAFEPSVFLTLDETTMYVTSEKDGGYGKLDVYVSEKDSLGNWSPLKNLGEKINTEEDEDISYVSPDKKTIYFSSKGHSSMGGYDVFKSVFENGEWSSPINMGSPVNTPYNDAFFLMTPKYNRGYYASERPEGKGGMDLYRLTFADERNPLAELAGLVLQGDSLVPAKSKITMNVVGEEISTVQNSKKQTGEYLILVEHGKRYEMLVETEGFAPYKKEFIIPDQVQYYQLYQEIHHVYLRDSEGNIIGQQIITHNAFDDINKSIRKDTLKQFYNKEDYSAFVRDTSNKTVQKFVDVKFYITEDSLLSLLEKDKNLKFIFPNYAEVSFLYKNDEQFRYALNSYVQGKKIDINYLKEKSILLNEYDNENEFSSSIADLKSPFDKQIILLFDYGKFSLINKSIKELNLLCDFMKQYPQIKFKINGYTDSRGSDEVNQKLSLNRAKEVYEYLVKKGVSKNRLKYEGFGSSNPIAPNINIDKTDNPEGRALNRRVEFELFD